MKNKNFPTWLVPLEIAKELKKIWFDEPCNHYVRISNDDIKLKINHSSIGLVILKRNSEYLNDDIASFVTIPTWEQVVEWFREKEFDSSIGLDNLPYPNKGIYYYFEISKINLYRINQLDWQGGFDDYNEAREVLVKALIQIYKREQYKIK